MKQFFYFLLLFGITLTACKKDKTTDIQPVDLSIKVLYDIQTSGYTLPLNNVVVKITNVNTGSVQSTKVNDKGEIIFTNTPAGIYDIDANVTIDAANYSQITSIQTTSPVTFNASSKNTQITVGFTGSINLKLVAGKTADWVIKQIYYAGSDNKNGALYRDQFIEFYNNSDKVLYADSLCFADITGFLSGPNNYNLLPSGQYDWSKSVGMPLNIDANNDYVYSRALFMIPGTGKQYPIQPGASIVVAQNAINHKAPFTGVDGKVVTVIDPSLTVDLSGANFETYYGNLPGVNPLSSDVDTQIPNVEVIQYFGRDMIFDTNGRYSFVLFKVDGTVNVKTLPQYNLPTKATPAATATKTIQIPIKFVLDAVEIQPNTADERIAKKFTPALDAGFTFVPLGGYKSQSVIRKTDKTLNGRIILKDTNNSTEDFDYLNIANPRGFK